MAHAWRLQLFVFGNSCYTTSTMEHRRPLESRLDDQAEVTALIVIIEDHIAKHGSFDSDTLEVNLFADAYATQLSLLLSDHPDTTEAWRVAYRGFHLSLMINDLAGLPRSLRLEEDVSPNSSHDERRDNLCAMSAEFLKRNPSLRLAIARFMPELDPNGNHSHLAETIVSLTSLQLERGYYARIAEQALADWDGTLNGLTDNPTE